MTVTQPEVEAPAGILSGSTDPAIVVTQDRALLAPKEAPHMPNAAEYSPYAVVNRATMVFLQRASAVVGIMLLLAGLVVWRFKPGDHRLALLILVCAMFLGILHYYTLEDSRNGEAGR